MKVEPDGKGNLIIALKSKVLGLDLNLVAQDSLVQPHVVVAPISTEGNNFFVDVKKNAIPSFGRYSVSGKEYTCLTAD